MSNLDHGYDEFFFNDFINNAIDALPNPVAILTGKFYTSVCSGIEGECIDTQQNPFYVLIWNVAEIFCD